MCNIIGNSYHINGTTHQKNVQNKKKQHTTAIDMRKCWNDTCWREHINFVSTTFNILTIRNKNHTSTAITNTGQIALYYIYNLILNTSDALFYQSQNQTNSHRRILIANIPYWQFLFKKVFLQNSVSYTHSWNYIFTWI